MLIALVLVIIAAAVFVGEFARSQPGWSLQAIGLAFLAAGVAVYFYLVMDKDLLR